MSSRISLTLLVALAASSAAVAQNTTDLKVFEPVFPQAYNDMRRDAAVSYGAKEYDKAFAQFQRLACAGDVESQSALGRMYIDGNGVQQDDLKGYAWLKMAAQVIFPKYQTVVKELEQDMTSNQRDVSNSMVADYMKYYSLSATGMSCSPAAMNDDPVPNEIDCVPTRQAERVMLRRCEAPEQALIKMDSAKAE
jgi:TPR repeat protein